jgi:hypothetical protein
MAYVGRARGVLAGSAAWGGCHDQIFERGGDATQTQDGFGTCHAVARALLAVYHTVRQSNGQRVTFENPIHPTMLFFFFLENAKKRNNSERR